MHFRQINLFLLVLNTQIQATMTMIHLLLMVSIKTVRLDIENTSHLSINYYSFTGASSGTKKKNTSNPFASDMDNSSITGASSGTKKKDSSNPFASDMDNSSMTEHNSSNIIIRKNYLKADNGTEPLKDKTNTSEKEKRKATSPTLNVAKRKHRKNKRKSK